MAGVGGGCVAARIRGVVAVGALALGAAAVSGCGGGDAVAAGSAPVGVAAHVPTGSLVYLEGSTDLDSAQWQMGLDLARRFPGFDRAVAEAKRELAKERLDLERDVIPLLGDSAALAVVSIDPATLRSTSGTPDQPPPMIVAIGIAQGKDAEVESKLAASKVTKRGDVSGIAIYRTTEAGSDEAWMAVNDGALLIATSEDVLRQSIAAHASGETMASSDRLRTVLGSLPDDTVAQGYVDLAGFLRIAKEVAPARAAGQIDELGVGPDAALGMSLTAEDQGLRIKAIATDYRPPGAAAAFSPTLADSVPADAVAYLGASDLFASLTAALDAAGKDETVKSQVTQLRGALALLGLSDENLKALLGGEAALMVGAGSEPGVPSVGAVLKVADGASVTGILSRLRETVAGLSGGKVPGFTGVDLANGVRGWESKVDDQASVVYGVDGDRALFGSSVAAVRRMQSPDPSLADSPAFAAATAQMPPRVSGIVWVNGSRLWPLLEAAGAFDDAPDEALANLRTVRSVAGWSTEGDTKTFEAVVTLR